MKRIEKDFVERYSDLKKKFKKATQDSSTF